MKNDIISIFAKGVDREVRDFLDPPGHGLKINLGAGYKKITGTRSLDRPEWNAGEYMPFDGGAVSAIYAYQFFEHLTFEEVWATLKECDRVLMSGGILNTVIPHWSGEAAYQDLDHKSFWSESSWYNLFHQTYYDRRLETLGLSEWSTILVGVVQRNLMIVSQLVKK